MEEYPEELRTPPVTLVSLVGLSEMHPAISAALHAEQPPINTLALPDFSKISILARKQRVSVDGAAGQQQTPVGGLLKREWLPKHRTKVPAVLAALFSAEQISGDPTQWQQVCTDIDNVKSMIRGRNIKFLVVLVQTSLTDEVSEDLITALKKRAEIDAKHLIIFFQKDASEQRQSLSRLVGLFAELSVVYYREEGRRIKTRIEKKNFSCMELNIRYCFKVAVYAEFRRDWAEALRFYEDGYRTLREMVGASTRLPPIQRLIEIKTVAEHFHFKVSTLLLHGGKVPDAVIWFRKHVGNYHRLIGALEVSFLHWEWLSRQYLVFAELLETSSAALPSSLSHHFGTTENPLTEWEFQPAYYYQMSARYLKEKKNALDRHSSLSEVSGMDNNLESVIPSMYTGQFARLLEEGDAISMFPISDSEYTTYAVSEGKRFKDSFEIIALFRRSQESFNSLKALRMSSYSSNMTAKEYFILKEFGNAKQLFDGIANLYRHEGWVTLLWESLGYLRECSRQLGLPKEFIEYSLEMSALPIISSVGKGEYGPGGVPSLAQRKMMQEEVFNILRGDSTLMSETSCNLSLEDRPILLEVDLVSPLRSVFLATVAFHDQTVKPGVATLMTLAIQSQLPYTVDIDHLEIQFNQPECNFTYCHNVPSTEDLIVEENRPREGAASLLTLEANKWKRLTCKIKSDQSGKLECISVIAKLGPNFSVCWRAESPASMEDIPLWKFEDRVETFPAGDPGLSFSGQRFIQVEEPDPQVDLILKDSVPALVGEIFSVPVEVVSRGHAIHSGELKINIVDARGGGLMSPREIESFSNDSVELLSVSGMTEEIKKDDSIEKITRTFGLISVPFTGVGDSWSGKLEIMWHRPKVVMLYVSLGYSPVGSESTSQKVNLHKSLQIEGKIPVSVDHHLFLPFRREPLLPLKIKSETDDDEITYLSLNETTTLVISARNSCEVPLRLLRISIEPNGTEVAKITAVSCTDEYASELAVLAPGEEFKQIFSVTPSAEVLKAGLGIVSLEWRRDSSITAGPDSVVVLKHKLPVVCIERAPLVVSFECPPYAVLGVPFMVCVKAHNLTKFLQEIRYSLGDSQSFIFSGSHNDSAYILPKSEGKILYKLVPLSSGHQQLPPITVTSVRYSASLCLSGASTTLFVFPSDPQFKGLNE